MSHLIDIIAILFSLFLGGCLGWAFGRGRPSSLSTVWEVANLERRFGASTHYLAVRVLDPDGNERVLFLTAHDYKEAVELAAANPEDHPPAS